jgi:hypothetical protein
MWNLKNIDYRIYYDRDVLLIHNNNSEIISGKLKFVSIPFHDISYDEVVICINDYNDHIISICNTNISYFYLDYTKRTKNNLKIIKLFLENKTNIDIYKYISNFLEKDLFEI